MIGWGRAEIHFNDAANLARGVSFVKAVSRNQRILKAEGERHPVAVAAAANRHPIAVNADAGRPVQQEIHKRPPSPFGRPYSKGVLFQEEAINFLCGVPQASDLNSASGHPAPPPIPPDPGGCGFFHSRPSPGRERRRVTPQAPTPGSPPTFSERRA